MNRQAKPAIKSLILTLRHKLEDDIAIQLKLYGFAGERWLPHIQGYDQVTIDHYRLKTALEQQLRRMGRATTHGNTGALEATLTVAQNSAR